MERLGWRHDATNLLACRAAPALLVSTAASAALSRAEQAHVRRPSMPSSSAPPTCSRRWVNQNSGTMNVAGVDAVRRMVEPEFEPLGFKTEWIDMKAAGRAGHLVARHAGSKRGKRLLLIAHLDTVFEPDSPFQRWQRDGEIAHGPGAGDDKGGIAVIVAALRAMQAAGTLKNANITVFLTGDEEDAGNPLTDLAPRPDRRGQESRRRARFRGSGGRRRAQRPVDMGSIARRSAGSWTVTVTGRSAHSSGVGARATVTARSTSWRGSSTSSAASFPRTS